MNLRRATELMEKYATCQECGSDFIGNGAGTLTVEDNIFRRSCECGWKIEVEEANHKTKGEWT